MTNCSCRHSDSSGRDKRKQGRGENTYVFGNAGQLLVVLAGDSKLAQFKVLAGVRYVKLKAWLRKITGVECFQETL